MINKDLKRIYFFGLILFGIVMILISALSIADDKYEENDEKDSAAEINEGEYEELWCDDEDDDWYKVWLDEGDDITVKISFDGDEADLDLELYDENDELLDMSDGVEDEEKVQAVDVEYTGYYYVYAYSWEFGTEYDMTVTFEIEKAEGVLNVEQGVFDQDELNLLNDCGFWAHIGDENVANVLLTIYDDGGSKVATGETDGRGEWYYYNLSNGEYSWTAEYDGESLEDEGTFDVAVGIRNVQAVSEVMDWNWEDEYNNDALFYAYDDNDEGVQNVECEIHWADNDTFYSNGVTEEEGFYIEYDLPEDNYTFTISYGETFNTGWLHSYGYDIVDGIINVAQGIFDYDDDNLLNDCNFWAQIKGDNVPGVDITIYDEGGSEVAKGTTDGNGEWWYKNMTNDEYYWTAEYDGEILEDDGTFDIAVGVREVQAYSLVIDWDWDDNYNDVTFLAYDENGDGVEGVECEIHWADNNTIYSSDVTDEDGNYEAYDLLEDNYTFELSYGETFNTGWFHSYGGGGGSPDYEEWFESYSNSTKDTGDDGLPDTISIYYDPDTEGDEVEITVWISIDFEGMGQTYNAEYTIYGDELDNFFEEYTASETGYYNFTVELYDDDGNWEDIFYIEEIYLYAEQGGDKTYLEGYVKDFDTVEAIVGATIILDGTTSYQDTTDANGYYYIECDEGDYTIEITHDEYEDYENDIYIDEGENWHNVTLAPIVTYIEGYVKNSDNDEPIEDIQVEIIGGENYNVLADDEGYYYIECEVGEYTIQISHNDYEDYSDEITIEKGENQFDIKLILKTVLTYLEGYVTDKDTIGAIIGAEVILDGTSYQDTTNEDGYYNIDCEVGNYIIKIIHDDYEEYSENINIVEGENQYNAELIPKVVVTYLEGYVTDSNTEEAIVDTEVTLESTSYKNSTNETGYYYIECPEGTYTILITLDDYEEYSDNINIVEGENQYNAELIQQAVVTHLVGFVTDSNTKDAITGAEVSLDGTSYLDTTDSKGYFIIECDEGDYIIMIENENYQDYSHTVSVEVGENEHNATLNPQETGGPEYGIELSGNKQIDINSGDQTDFEIIVKNIGNTEEKIIFNLDGDKKTWGNLIISDSTIKAGESKTIKITFNVPVDANEGDNKIIFNAYPENYEGAKEEWEITLKVTSGEDIPEYGIELSEDSKKDVKAGEKITFSITVENIGTLKDKIYLNLSGEKYDWGGLSLNELELESGENNVITLTVEVPKDTKKGEYKIEVVANSGRDPQNSTTSTVTVTVTEDDVGKDDSGFPIIIPIGIAIAAVGIIGFAVYWKMREEYEYEDDDEDYEDDEEYE